MSSSKSTKTPLSLWPVSTMSSTLPKSFGEVWAFVSCFMSWPGVGEADWQGKDSAQEGLLGCRWAVSSGYLASKDKGVFRALSALLGPGGWGKQDLVFCLKKVAKAGVLLSGGDFPSISMALGSFPSTGRKMEGGWWLVNICKYSVVIMIFRLVCQFPFKYGRGIDTW